MRNVLADKKIESIFSPADLLSAGDVDCPDIAGKDRSPDGRKKSSVSIALVFIDENQVYLGQ